MVSPSCKPVRHHTADNTAHGVAHMGLRCLLQGEHQAPDEDEQDRHSQVASGTPWMLLPWLVAGLTYVLLPCFAFI